MNSEKHVEQELNAYLDGEVSRTEAARIEKHLVSCASCRAALHELRLVRQDLSTTLETALAPIRLSRKADERIRQVIRSRLEHRTSWWQAFWQRRGLVSQAVMAIFIVLVSVMTFRVMAPSTAIPVHETIVLGQDQFAPGSQGAIRVVVQSLGSALPFAVPVSDAEVLVSLARKSGFLQELYSGQTDDSGSADVTFTMPDDVEGDAELIVETSSSAGTERIVRPIHIERSYKIYLGSDKPVYRPGQVLYLRALVFDAVGNTPAVSEKITFHVLDDETQIIFEKRVSLSDYGVGYTGYHIPVNAESGSYTIRAAVGAEVAERTVEVNPYPPPVFNIDLETVESFAVPGSTIHGTVTCSYFFSKPVQGSARIIAYAGEYTVLHEFNGVLNSEGKFNFIIDLPGSLDQDSLTIIVTVMDNTGRVEGLKRSLVVSASPILIKAIPESGHLKLGLENIIYLATAYPDGIPAQTNLQLVVDENKYKIKTDAYGLTTFRFTPQASTELYVEARDAEGRVAEEWITLPADTAARSLLLRVERGAYTVGETIYLETLVAGDDITHIYLDVVREGQTAAVLSAPVVDHSATFAFDLDGLLAGSLNLRAYALSEGSIISEDTRLVVVDPAGSLDLAVSADQEEYQPGNTAHLRVATSIQAEDRVRKPVQSLLGVAVVDTSVLSLEMLPPGFARTFFLMGSPLMDRRSILTGFDPPSLLEGDETTRTAQDVAARASWAGLQNIEYDAPSRMRIEGTDENAVQRSKFTKNLSWILILLPIGNSVLVVQGLLPSGVFWRATRRLGWGLLALTLLSPVLISGLVLGLLLPWLGTGLAAIMIFMVSVLIIGLLILGWVHHDTRLQLAVVLMSAYVIIWISVLILLSMSAESALSYGMVVILTAFFLVFLTSLFILGQGFVIEGRKLDGWILSLLVICLILLAISLPSIPRLNSNLSRTISNPFLYAGPFSWLSGCAPLSLERAETEVPAAEKETEATAMPAATPSPMATAVPQLPGTATPVTIPLEPYPVRQIFPETLFWAPDVETSELGIAEFDVDMADTLTTWRLTALGSTKDGYIGAASYDLRVFQDFFIDVQVEDILRVDEPASMILSVYNYQDTPQIVKWSITSSEDFIIDTLPDVVEVDAGAVTSTVLQITPLRTGKIILDIEASGDDLVDNIRLELDVTGE